ncbi:MAG: glycosyltransferase [Acidobacteriota bacterium]|nr:glycosyltransferase [Acidobacteriota bacterium]
MRVAVYYPWVYVHGGPERVLTQIVARSRHQWTIYTNRYEAESTFPSLRQADIVQLPQVSVKRSFVHVVRAAWQIARQRLPLRDERVLFVFCEGLGDMVLLRKYGIPVACLCFTPLRAAFDPYYRRGYLEMKGKGIARRLALQFGSAVFRAIDRKLWKRYDRVYAISEEVRRRIAKGHLCSSTEIEILYPGVDIERLLPGGTGEKRFLIAGRIMWTKNLELGIRSFELLLTRRPDLGVFTLTLAGYVDRKSQGYLTKLRALASACPQIRFVESPSDPELFALCRSAYAILYTPLNEDWGLIPLEMMALEKPIIAVNRGGPRETVVDGSTGFLVEPTIEAFASAMETLADDPDLVRSMGRRARQRAGEFDWASFCEKLDDSVDQLAGSAHSQPKLSTAATGGR